MEWYYVDEEYPPQHERVLVYVEEPGRPREGFTTIASWDGGTWYSEDVTRCWWTFPGYRPRATQWAYVPVPEKPALHGARGG